MWPSSSVVSGRMREIWSSSPKAALLIEDAEMTLPEGSP
jgi:hypothetical protein